MEPDHETSENFIEQENEIKSKDNRNVRCFADIISSRGSEKTANNTLSTIGPENINTFVKLIQQSTQKPEDIPLIKEIFKNQDKLPENKLNSAKSFHLEKKNLPKEKMVKLKNSTYEILFLNF